MKKVVEITVENAIKAYNDAPKEFKPTLEKLIGKDVLKLSIMDRVKTLEDALELVDVSDEMMLFVTTLYSDPHLKAASEQAKMEIIIEALNEGWEPDWSNSNETKYYPWLEFRPGVGWAFDDFIGRRTVADCGSRLAYRTRELAEYGAKQFQVVYNNFL